jgi:hypothetical protein
MFCTYEIYNIVFAHITYIEDETFSFGELVSFAIKIFEF